MTEVHGDIEKSICDAELEQTKFNNLLNVIGGGERRIYLMQ